MNLLQRIVPHPFVTLAIIGLWVALAGSYEPGTVVMATIVGLAVPQLTSPFWPDPPRLRRPVAGLLLFIRVMGDIILANIEVARQVLGPIGKLKPAFIEVPLAVEDTLVATMLGSIVSLTPGTVSIEIDTERRVLLVHALHVEDREATIQNIKSRYEAPLKEIFGC
jgi:multicomponent K+:H+ antiporter subunit E